MRGNWPRVRSRCWLPSPMQACQIVLGRLSRDRSLDVEEFARVAQRLARRYSGAPNLTLNALGLQNWPHEWADVRGRGVYFRGRWVCSRNSWKNASEQACREGRQWFFIDTRTDVVHEARVEAWEAAKVEADRNNYVGSWRYAPYTKLFGVCACGKRWATRRRYNFARRREDQRVVVLCWPCMSRWERADKREAELAGLRRELNRLTKEIRHGRKDQNDRGTARVPGEHDAGCEERRREDRRGGTHHEVGSADPRVVLLRDQDREGGNRVGTAGGVAGHAAHQPRVTGQGAQEARA